LIHIITFYYYTIGSIDPDGQKQLKQKAKNKAGKAIGPDRP